MPADLLLKRKHYTRNTTIGELYINNTFFCFTLEDVVRGKNIKIPGHTAIPDGKYNVALSFSNTFKRMMPIIFNQQNGYELISNGISFKGIRMHGGNTHEDTKGCIIVARSMKNYDTVYGSMEKELTKRISELGGEGFITIINEKK